MFCAAIGPREPEESTPIIHINDELKKDENLFETPNEFIRELEKR
jgi:hypothetical protein